MKKKMEVTQCPFCKSLVDVDIDWAIRNERIFCNSCCKAFPIRVGEETQEKEEPVEIVEEKKSSGPDYWDEF